MTLTPSDMEDDDRNPVELRCDTLSEATTWIDILQRGIKNAGSYHISALNQKSLGTTNPSKSVDKIETASVAPSVRSAMK